MKRSVVVLDSELESFGVHNGHSALDCASHAAGRLVSRHPALVTRIGLIVVGAARTSSSDGRSNGLAQDLAQLIGLPEVAGVDVHAFSASGNVAVREAALAIEAGRTDVAMVVGCDHVSSLAPTAPLETAPLESAYGFTPAVFYGLCAARYLYETGATLEALCQVAVNNRQQGATNTLARFHARVSLAEVANSRVVASPLTLFQCCAPADGAGALLLVAGDALSRTEASQAVRLVGLGLVTNDRDDAGLTSFPEDARAAAMAYEEAGIGPEDVTVAEVHDAFTISQIIHIEDLGFARRGEGWRHALGSSSRPVVNAYGGLLSRGHPLGATGIAQFDSVRRYLSDPAVARSKRRFGVVQEPGGMRTVGQVLSTCAVMAGPGISA